MKWLLTEDEDVLTGFLIGCFLVSGFFTLFFLNAVYFFLPFIFLFIWIYALIKRGKIKKEKANEEDSY